MNIELAKLVVALEAQTAKFNSDMAGVTKRLDGFARQSQAAARKSQSAFAGMQQGLKFVSGALATFGIGFGVSAIISGFKSAALEAINYGDDLLKASQKTGMTVESMSELAYAAKQSDVDLQSLGTALKKMQITLSEAGSGSKSANEALAALGLTFADLKGLAPEQQFELLAQQISSLKDPADRTRAAVDLFGRSGADLLPMFEAGAAGIRAAREEAQRLGITMTEEQAKSLAAADDSIKRLSSAWLNMKRLVIGDLAPTITAAIDSITNALSENGRQALTWGKVWEAVALTMAMGPLGAIKGFVRAFRTDPEQNSQRSNRSLSVASPVEPKRPAPGYAAGAGGGGGTKGLTEAERATQAIQQQIVALRQQVETFNASEAGLLAYRATLGDLSDEFKKAGPAAEPMRLQLIELGVELSDLKIKTDAENKALEESNKLKEDAKQVIEGLKDGYALAADKVALYNKMVEAGVLTDEQRAAAIKQVSEALAEQVNKTKDATDKMTVFWDQAMRNMQDILGEALFNSFEDGVDGMVLQWAQALKRMAAEALAAQIFSALGSAAKGAAGGGGFWGWLIGGVVSAFGGAVGGGAVSGGMSSINGLDMGLVGLAKGGTIFPGGMYLVGENGPELVTPRSPGMVLPAKTTSALLRSALRGSTDDRTPISITMNITTPDADSFMRTQTQIQARLHSSLGRASQRKN